MNRKIAGALWQIGIGLQALAEGLLDESAVAGETDKTREDITESVAVAKAVLAVPVPVAPLVTGTSTSCRAGVAAKPEAAPVTAISELRPDDPANPGVRQCRFCPKGVKESGRRGCTVMRRTRRSCLWATR